MLLTAAVSGCEVWLDVDSTQCRRDETCVSMLGAGATCGAAGVCVRPEQSQDAGPDADTRPALPDRWACLRSEPRGFVPDPDRKIRLRLDVVDVVSLEVPNGLIAEACTPGDVECDRPVASDVVPGSDGFLEFELPYGFEGFITFEAPDHVPSLSYDSRPYTESLTTSGPAIVTPAVLTAISGNSGTDEADVADLGLIFIEVRDCQDAAADGVRFENVGDVMPFYFQGALPARDLTMTTISNQLAAGREPRAIGGFSNLQPGYTTFQATLPETGDVVSRLTVQIRAGHITYVRMRAGY